MKRFVIAVYVENKFGVLTRVTGMFMRKGFNIDSLSVGETDNPEFSRITIVLSGDEHDCLQVINQLNKLYNVKTVKLIDDNNKLILDSPDLTIPLKTGIPSVYGFKTIEECID